MPITPPKDFMRDIDAQLAKLKQMDELIMRELAYIGDEAVTLARTQHQYKDQTGCLTSSIGYVIVRDGQVALKSSFEPVKPTGEPGSIAGRAYVDELAAKYPTGYTLIIVAGMNYAAYVEKRGLGGMTAAELDARRKAEDVIQGLVNDINKLTK